MPVAGWAGVRASRTRVASTATGHAVVRRVVERCLIEALS
jgi:hypothetical protein